MFQCLCVLYFFVFDSFWYWKVSPLFHTVVCSVFNNCDVFFFVGSLSGGLCVIIKFASD